MGSDGYTYYDNTVSRVLTSDYEDRRARKLVCILEMRMNLGGKIFPGSKIAKLLDRVKSFGNGMEETFGDKYSTHGWADVDGCLASAGLPRAHTIKGSEIISHALSLGAIQFREKLPGKWSPDRAIQEVRYVRGLESDVKALPAPEPDVIVDAEFNRKD